jgi:hypothetical protein
MSTTRTGISIDDSELQRAIANLTAKGFEAAALPPLRNATRKSINAVRRHVRAEARGHKRSGRMARNVRTRFTRMSAGWQFTGAMRATGAPSNLIVGGVKPHAIALGGRVMPMWGGKGKWSKGAGAGVEGFARKVQHPGFAADPFVDRGIDRASEEIHGYMNDAVQVMARELAYRLEGKR